jgi:hypothetical protein
MDYAGGYHVQDYRGGDASPARGIMGGVPFSPLQHDVGHDPIL